MNCPEFENLTIVEKIDFIGKLTHIVQTDKWYYEKALEMVNKAELNGKFKNVTINPEEIEGQVIPPMNSKP